MTKFLCRYSGLLLQHSGEILSTVVPIAVAAAPYLVGAALGAGVLGLVACMVKDEDTASE